MPHSHKRGTIARNRGWAVLVGLLGLTGLMTASLIAPATAGTGGYHRSNLVSDIPGKAQLTDPDMVNAWGLALGPTTPAWVNATETGVSTIYPGAVHNEPITKAPLTVTIPKGDPTGAVFNRTSHFVVRSGGASGPALFLFDSETGRISGWNPGVPAGSSTSTRAITVVHKKNAIFKGLTKARTSHGPRLYAADFHSGRIDVFNGHFDQLHPGGGAFSDPTLPAGYAPFNIKKIGDRLYVAYAKQDAAAEDEVAGPGRGFVDVYDFEGNMLMRLASHGTLNAPWGLALARPHFGPLSGALLVGNFGDGHISAFDPDTGAFMGRMRNGAGRLVTIDGLWSLRFGNGVTGSYRTLLFTAGPDDETHGLFGAIHAHG